MIQGNPDLDYHLAEALHKSNSPVKQMQENGTLGMLN